MLYSQVFMEKKGNLKSLILILIKSALPIVLLIIFNLFWLLPSIQIGSLNSNDAVNRDIFGSSYLTIINSLGIFHPFWKTGEIIWFKKQNIPLYFWLSPLISVSCFIIYRKKPLIQFFGLITLIGIFLSKQESAPFINIYSWLFLHFPGFNAFREATKFQFMISIGYSVLIGSFSAFIWNYWNKNKLQKVSKFLLISIIGFSFFYNTFSIIDGTIKTSYITREVPQDYIILNNFISKKNIFFRSFWTPEYSRWSIYTIQKPIISNVGAINSTWKHFFKFKKNSSIQEQIVAIYENSFSKNIFDQASIKYVIIPPQDKENDDDFYVWYGGNRNFFIQKIKKLSWLKQIDIGTKNLLIFENLSYRPHIYTTESNETLSSYVPYNIIEFSTINSTRYIIKIPNTLKPFNINFTDLYSQDWEIRIGNFNWFNALFKLDYFVDSKYHSESDSKLNSFYINPTVLCKKYSCKKNVDGTFDMNLTLYFKPQSYMYIGLIISGSAFIICISYLVIIGIKELKKRND